MVMVAAITMRIAFKPSMDFIHTPKPLQVWNLVKESISRLKTFRIISAMFQIDKRGDDPNPRTRCRTPSMPVSTKPRS